MKDKKKVKRALKHFNFEKVHKIMETLNWTWVSAGDKVPSVDFLKETAKKYLYDVLNDKEYHVVGSGGFEASYIDGVLALRFVAEEWSVDCEED